jgi:hypothetical protein
MCARVSVHQPLWYHLTPYSPIPSTSSAMKTQENKDKNPDDPEPADDGDIKIEYISD